jgi:hypothetical protein
MGFKLVLLAVGTMLVLYTIHSIFNTPYDWFLLLFGVCLVALAIPDRPVIQRIREIWAMVKWVDKQRTEAKG